MKRTLLLFLALAMMPFVIIADNLVVQKLDRTELRHALEAIGRLEFDLHQEASANADNAATPVAPDLLLIGKDGQLLAVVSIDDVSKIILDSEELNAIDAVSSDPIHVVAENGYLKVEGPEQTATLRVFDASGKLLLSNTGNAIYVGALPDGVYLLQCGMNIVKFTK